MIVSEIDLFKGLNYDVMKQIADICEEDWYLKGKVLFEKHEKASRLYILQQGTINLIIDDSAGIVYPLSDPGEVIGWSSMVDAGEYTATAVCDSEVLAIRIEKEKLDRVFDQHPDSGLAVLRRIGTVFSKRLTNAYRELMTAGK